MPHFQTDAFYQRLLGKEPKVRRTQSAPLQVFHEQDWADDPSVFGVPVHQQEFQTEREVEDDQPDGEIEWRFDEQDADGGACEEEDQQEEQDGDGQPSSSSSNSGSSSSSSAQTTPRGESPPPPAPVPEPAAEGPPPPPPVPEQAAKRQKMFHKHKWFCWSYQEYLKAEGYSGVILHCNLDGHNLHGEAPCSKTLSHTVLGAEHTLLALQMWAVVGGTVDTKKEHKDLWKHCLKVYKERGLGYSEEELQERARKVEETWKKRRL